MNLLEDISILSSYFVNAVSSRTQLPLETPDDDDHDDFDDRIISYTTKESATTFKRTNFLHGRRRRRNDKCLPKSLKTNHRGKLAEDSPGSALRGFSRRAATNANSRGRLQFRLSVSPTPLFAFAAKVKIRRVSEA